jgi:hypothetical protein
MLSPHTTHTETHTTHTHTHTPRNRYVHAARGIHTHTHRHTHTNGRRADQMLSTHSIHAAQPVTQTQHTRSTILNTGTTERQGDQKLSTYRSFVLNGKVFFTYVQNYFLDGEARRPEAVHLSLMIYLKCTVPFGTAFRFKRLLRLG